MSTKINLSAPARTAAEIISPRQSSRSAMKHFESRQVLECAPDASGALCLSKPTGSFARPQPKRQRTGAVHDAGAPNPGSGHLGALAPRWSLSRAALPLAALCLLLGIAGPAPASGADTAAQAKSERESEPGGIIDIGELVRITETRYGAVSAATGHSQPITEAPSAVTIILGEDIQKGRPPWAMCSQRRWTLRHLRPQLRLLGARGFNQGDPNSRAHPRGRSSHQSQHLRRRRIVTSFLLDVDLIDRVEIVRGRSSPRKQRLAHHRRPPSEIADAITEVSGAAGTSILLAGLATAQESCFTRGQPVNSSSGSISDSRGTPSSSSPNTTTATTTSASPTASTATGSGRLQQTRLARLHARRHVDRTQKYNPTAPVGASTPHAH